ncbi:cyclin-A1-1-like isoform X3 [Zingiber officinale]|uniref:cyclin-A1-1-like isoform X3 n=1 Tax=Zingiber officinale TaxID=94328 RepID=UPI001C4A9F52|nr:cyclin-A1-1-like isoform X3 [Zingiber officinale]
MNRRSSVSSSTSAAMASSKRTEAMEVSAKFTAARAAQGKKRVALRDISKQSNVLRGTPSLVGAKGANTNATRSISMVKKGSCTTYCDSRLSQTSSVLSASIKPNAIESSNKSSLPHSSVSKPAVVTWLVPCTALKSPNFSGDSVSSMSTCNSIQSPEFEYIDNGDSQATTSLERQANEDLIISEHVAVAESKSKSNGSMLMEVEVVEVDTNHNDPQFCTTLACDIYQNLQKSETKKRPSIDFMETIQKDITANMRSILIDWLVEVAEEYHLVPDTLYLSVNYLDRYLSGNEINRERLQLLGVACMLIAAKYEETCAPQVEDFCCMTDNTYSKDEVLRMESEVLNYLKFEMTVPTTKCFLRRFVHAAQGSNQLCCRALITRLLYASLCLITGSIFCCLFGQVHIATSEKTLERHAEPLHAIQTFGPCRLCRGITPTSLH